MFALHRAMIAVPIGTEIIPFVAKMAYSFKANGLAYEAKMQEV